VLWTVDVVRETKAAHVLELREVAKKIDLHKSKVIFLFFSFFSHGTYLVHDGHDGKEREKEIKFNFYLLMFGITGTDGKTSKTER
jgi:hypothetical protein